MSNDIVPIPAEYQLNTEELLWEEFIAQKGGTIYHSGDAEWVETIQSEIVSVYTDDDYNSLMYRRAGNFSAVVQDYLNSYAERKEYAAGKVAALGGYIMAPIRRDTLRAKLSDLCARIVKVLPSISPADGDARLKDTGFFASGFGGYTLNAERVRASIYPVSPGWKYTVEIVELDEDLFTGDFEFLTSTAISTFVSYQMGQAAQAAIQSGNVTAQYALAGVQASRGAVSGDFNDVLDAFAQSTIKIWLNTPDTVDSPGATIETLNNQPDAITMPLQDYETPSGYLDYEQAFNPVDYSSGEGFAISSDSQNVDFGFGAGGPSPDIHYNWGDQLLDPAPVSDGFNVTFGATPENTSSSFGTVTYPMETQGASSFSLGTIKSAIQTGKSVIDTGRALQSIVSGGGAKFSASTPPYVAPGSSSAGVMVQRESNMRTQTIGQLSPGGTPVSSSHSSVAIIAIAAIAGFLLIRKGA